MSKAEEAALAAANTVLDEDSVEAEETPSEPTEPVAAEPQETEPEPAFVLEPELPEDLAEELETPEFEDEPEPEPQYAEDEYVDEDTSELQRKLAAAEKKAHYYENLRLQSDRKKWEAEATKFFPLSVHALPDIEAKSHRSFLRKAKAAHEAVLPYVKQATAAAQAELDATREAVIAEAKAQAIKDWGEGTMVVGDVPAQATEAKARYEALRAAGAPLEKLILARKDAGEYDNL